MDDREEPGSFGGLPAELHLMIMEYFDKPDLAALSRVSKGYNSICRPIIFRNVDLSIHNRGKVSCTFSRYPLIKWDEPSDSLQCNNVPPNLQKRQEAFLSALIENPSLAQHVDTFSWTLLLLDSNRRDHLRIDPFAIDKKVPLNPKSPFNEIWNVFASLTSVRTLNLAWLSRHLAMPLIHSIPPVLFPAATSVRLVGVMPYALAASILLANPQALLHLDFDNLQQSGIIPSTHIDKLPDNLDETNALADTLDQTSMRRRVPRTKKRPADPIPNPTPSLIIIPPHRQTRQSWNNLVPFPNSPWNESKYFNAPGPMQNLLGALAGKCTSLKTLHLRKVGARDRFDFDPASHRKEPDIYAEWAIFLASVKPTLESLTVEQGERLLPRAYVAQPRVRPMDQLFGDVIFPVLVRGDEWLKLKKLVVRGVQRWKEDDGVGRVLVDGRGELRGRFGKGVEVVMGRRAREADHLGVGYENVWRGV